MKKVLAVLLTLILLLSAVWSSGAEAPDSGFDPETVVRGMLERANAQLSNNVTVTAEDTPGLYTVYYKAADMGCYLNIGKRSAEGTVNDRIEFSESFIFDNETAQAYLAFYLCCSAALVQYLTEEDFGTAAKALSDALNTAMAAEEHTCRYTVGTYEIKTDVMTGSGMVLFDLEITVQDAK